MKRIDIGRHFLERVYVWIIVEKIMLVRENAVPNLHNRYHNIMVLQLHTYVSYLSLTLTSTLNASQQLLTHPSEHSRTLKNTQISLNYFHEERLECRLDHSQQKRMDLFVKMMNHVMMFLTLCIVTRLAYT